MSPIKKIPLNRALDLEVLYNTLFLWRRKNEKTFRLDGKNSTQANPAQIIYFHINSFKKNNFKGIENEQEVYGTHWNGSYYLAGSTRSNSVAFFLESYKRHNGNIADIFILAYTLGREGNPRKRRLFLKKGSEGINKGWICKQVMQR